MAVIDKPVCRINTFNDHENREILRENIKDSLPLDDSLSNSYRSITKHLLSDFDYSLESLQELKIPDPDLESEGEIAVASDYSYSEAYKLLRELYQDLRLAFPYCSATLESQGGIDLVWDNPESNKRVWIEIPFSSNLQGSVFYRQNEDSKFINYINVKQVYNLLIWLFDDKSVDDCLS